MDYLKMKPREWLCPFCGEWHQFTEEMSEVCDFVEGKKRRLFLYCKEWERSLVDTEVTLKEDTCYLDIASPCKNVHEIIHQIPISQIGDVIDIYRETNRDIRKCQDYRCEECRNAHSYNCVCKGCPYADADICMMHKNCERKGLNYMIKVQFGLRFEEKENTTESNIVEKEENTTESNIVEKETFMKKNTIFDQLYRHSPEENVGIIKEWAEKHKSTLQWAVPVVSIYAAYRILKSPSFSTKIEKLGNECEKKLGFTLEPLKDKKALRELMVLGGATAGAYAAIKGIGSIFNTEDEISSESVEEGMSKLEKIHQKFAWITPKTEKLLPVAVSVIVFYMMTQKPEMLKEAKEKGKNITEDLVCKASVYLGLVKLFVADKLSIDISNEEEVQKLRKFAFLAAIAGLGLFLYGTKCSDKQEHNDQEDFLKQLLNIMKKLMPTAFAGVTSYLVAKNFMPKEYAEVIQPETDTEEIIDD